MQSKSIALAVAVSLLVTLPAAAHAQARRNEVRPVRPTAPYPDPWFGEDKVQHFVASAGVTTLAFGAARVALDHEGATGVGIGVGALAGLLKEVHDHRIGRPFSLRDLVYDAAGIAVAWLWIREIE